MKRKILNYALIFVFIFCGCASAERFIPEQPVMTVNELRPGMSGYALTVVKGTAPIKIPVKIVSVLPQKPGTSMKDKILIKFTGKNKLAQGMSGSPVFIKNKLIGGIRSGWENSDQSLALVTPIEAMTQAFENGGLKLTNEELKLFNISVTGINANSLSRFCKATGLKVNQGLAVGSGALDIKNVNFKPGDAVSALLVWGDVEVSATGTITATTKDGKFLAFGHDFLNRGRSNYPAAGAFVHETIDSYNFPFKIASPLYINGTITTDCDAAIGGQAGLFPQSFAAELNFKNLDTNKQTRYKFRVVPDEFLTAKLIEDVYKGLVAEAWGRKGQGTMNVSLKIEGGNVPKGFVRRDAFFSDEDITEAALKDSAEIIGAYLTQPFSATMPSGFILNVEATEKPKILRIEDVEVPSFVKPGEEFEIKVTLREWRNQTTVKTFKLRAPRDASGIAEIVVRAGGVEPMPQTAIEENTMTIDSLKRMFSEFKAIDANNEIIIELNTDTLSAALENALNRLSDDEEDDYLPEELEFLSETQERRIKEGTLKIFSSDYVVDGMLKRLIHIKK